MPRVLNPEKVEIGDFFLQGGQPGHAVLVVDVAENNHGDRAFLVAQSYMPAQSRHILLNPSTGSPWYLAKPSGALVTPEWHFVYEDLRRFSPKGCP